MPASPSCSMRTKQLSQSVGKSQSRSAIRKAKMKADSKRDSALREEIIEIDAHELLIEDDEEEEVMKPLAKGTTGSRDPFAASSKKRTETYTHVPDTSSTYAQTPDHGGTNKLALRTHPPPIKATSCHLLPCGSHSPSLLVIQNQKGYPVAKSELHQIPMHNSSVRSQTSSLSAEAAGRQRQRSRGESMYIEDASSRGLSEAIKIKISKSRRVKSRARSTSASKAFSASSGRPPTPRDEDQVLARLLMACEASHGELPTDGSVQILTCTKRGVHECPAKSLQNEFHHECPDSIGVMGSSHDFFDYAVMVDQAPGGLKQKTGHLTHDDSFLNLDPHSRSFHGCYVCHAELCLLILAFRLYHV